jgi:hypothetical protein
VRDRGGANMLSTSMSEALLDGAGGLQMTAGRG